MKAAVWFADEAENASIAARLNVSVRTVEKWRRTWREGGAEALRSKGQGSVSRLSQDQLKILNTELRRGPGAHGFSGKRWTLAKIALLIEQTFQVNYTLQGVRKLLLRNGLPWRRPKCDTSSTARVPAHVDEGTIDGVRPCMRLSTRCTDVHRQPSSPYAMHRASADTDSPPRVDRS
jgi:transposase